MRLAHQLSLILIATALSAVLAMGGFMAWHLQRGFSDYLAVQEQQRLQAFATSVQTVVAAQGLDALRNRPWLLNGTTAGHEPAPPLEPPRRPPPPRPGRERLAGPPPGPALAGEVPLNRRGLTVVDAERQLVWGQLPPNPRRTLEAPIVVAGRTVAFAQLTPRPDAPEAVDQRFLTRQLWGILSIGAGVAVLAALLAWRLAARWLQPVAHVQQASHRLAQGDFSVRLPRRAPTAHDEFDALVDDINRMAQALQELEATRRRWIAEVSHELRTPLTVLRGELDALRDGVRSFSPERLDAMGREVQRLRRLADDFQLLALADLNALPCVPEVLDPARLLQQVTERHQAPCAALGLELTLDLQALPPTVRWDGERIVQVLDNLLTNARHYTEAPGQIRVLARRQGGQIEVQVEDSAPGVPPALLPRLFDPLFRADPARPHHDGVGSGLGLAVARAWVRRHGGQIQAQASALGGLAVRVHLPLEVPP